MSIKVNGINYGWGDVDVKIPGLNLVVQEISYDDEQEMEESYGKGYRPRGYGKGNYKASGKMSMLRDDFDDVLDYCKATGKSFYNVELPSVVVSYGNPGGGGRASTSSSGSSSSSAATKRPRATRPSPSTSTS